MKANATFGNKTIATTLSITFLLLCIASMSCRNLKPEAIDPPLPYYLDSARQVEVHRIMFDSTLSDCERSCYWQEFSKTARVDFMAEERDSILKACNCETLEPNPFYILYPNPVEGRSVMIQFLFPRAGQRITIRVFDDSGKTYFSVDEVTDGNDILVDLSSLPSGKQKFYMGVRITDPEGQECTVQFLKQK